MSGDIFKGIRGTATGIGSLPFSGAAAAQEAVEAVFSSLPLAPFWPQLPKRDYREGMLVQFSEHLPCLRLEDRDVRVRNESRDQELETFYEHLLADDVGYFGISREYAQGFYAFLERLSAKGTGKARFLKGHITGPFTFASCLKDAQGVMALHDEVLMQALVKGLAMKARWQARAFREFGVPCIIFIDEPYLGCFGSAYTPITKEDVTAGIGELCASLKEEGIITGVHCCGNTDWTLFTDIPGIDIINFDAFGFLDKFVLYADALQRFISQGVLCWGVVPTQEISGSITALSLEQKIEEGITMLSKKGVDPALLRSRLMVSPSCGLGTLTPQAAKSVLSMLSEVSLRLQKP